MLASCPAAAGSKFPGRRERVNEWVWVLNTDPNFESWSVGPNGGHVGHVTCSQSGI